MSLHSTILWYHHRVKADLTFFGDREINKELPIPIYYQLKEILLEYAKQADEGERFPTDEQLCARYGISRPTARQAIREVELSGYVRRMKGKGTFVRRQAKLKEELTARVESFGERMRRLGCTTRAELLELKETSREERGRAALELPTGSPLYLVRRIIYADETPMALALSYFPVDLLPALKEEVLTKEPLLPALSESYGLSVSQITKSLESKMIGYFEAEIFALGRNVPVQYVETTSHLEGGRIVEFSMERYRADLNQFTIHLSKGG